MFCTNCGKPLADGAKFCTNCGAQVRAEKPAPPESSSSPESPAGEPPSTSTPSVEEPPRKRGRAGKIIAVIVLVEVALGIAGATLSFFFGGDGALDGSSAESDAVVLEVYYASDETVQISASTVIVAYDASGEVLEEYSVDIDPLDADAAGWDAVGMSVSTGSFSFGWISDLEPGFYDVTIIDGEDTYQPIHVEVVDEEELDEDEAEELPDQLNLVPDPDEPDAALVTEVAYGYTVESATVHIYYEDEYADYVYDYDTEWTYPQLTCTVESEIVDALNQKIADWVQERIDNNDGWSYDTSEDPFTELYQVAVTYLEDGVVSLRVEAQETYFGVHGWSSVTGVTYNLETGERVSVETIDDDLPTYRKQELATAAIEAYLESNPSDLYETEDLADTIEAIVENQNRYYIAAEGIVVITLDYELGSFAFGCHEIVVYAFENESLVGTDVIDTYASYGTSS